MRAFYSDHFVLPLPDGHKFPMAKYSRLRERILDEGVIAPADLHEAQFVGRGGRRFMKIVRRNDPLGEDPFAQPGVLRHRELVSLGKRQHEMIRVERAHGATD